MVTDDEQTADKLTFKITAAHHHHHYKEVVWNHTQHYRFDIYYHRLSITKDDLWYYLGLLNLWL